MSITTRFTSLSRLGLAAALVTLPFVGCADEYAAGRGGADEAPAEGGPAQGGGPEEGRPAGGAAFAANGNSAVEGAYTAEGGGEALAIEKTVPERIRLGTPLTYRIAVTPGQDLQSVTVREKLPEGFAFESSTPEAEVSENGRMLTFRMNGLQEGATQTIEIEGTPQQVGSLQACTTYEIERGVCTAFEVVNPELRLTKQGPETAGVCEPVTYTYVIQNQGQTAAENVVLYDRLPEGLQVIDGEGEGGLRLEVGTLEPGQEIRREVQVVAETPLQDAGSFAYAESSLDEVRSQRVATRFIAPNLELQARAERPYGYIGKNVTFDVTVRNTGETPAPQTKLRVDVQGAGELAGVNGQDPQRARLTEGEDGGAIDGDGIDIGTLAPGETRTVAVDVAAEDAGRIRLEAMAAALCGRGERTLAQAEVGADVQVRTLSALQVYAVDKQDPVKVGEETTYELSVFNEGSAVESNLQVTAQLPEGASFVGADGPTDVQQADGGQLTFAPVSKLPPGESATWYIGVRAEEAAGNTEFTASVTTDQIEEAVQTAEPTRLY